MSDQPRWTIGALATAAQSALAAAPDTPRRGRGRAAPDVRTIRYYTSIGLLAAPLGTAGRAALYGELHLAQLVAIKHLQARGATLDEIRQQLTDASLHDLHKLAPFDSPPLPPSDIIPQPPPLPSPCVAHPVRSVSLGEGVTLTLTTGRGTLSREDLTAIGAAAAPLMQALSERGLLS